MTTALIIGGLLLVGVGMVASQLFRLKDWLNRQPPPAADGERPGEPNDQQRQ
ncbi:MAG: hypothetical protein ACKOQ4_01400 [Mycobacterium sp.]